MAKLCLVSGRFRWPFSALTPRWSFTVPSLSVGSLEALAGAHPKYGGYDDLEIKQGGQASLEGLRVHFGTANDAERQQVRRNLERYCGLDTEGMIWIVDELRRLCG
jgi:hypothetical protein